MTRFEFDNLPSMKFGILLCVCVFVIYLRPDSNWTASYCFEVSNDSEKLS